MKTLLTTLCSAALMASLNAQSIETLIDNQEQLQVRMTLDRSTFFPREAVLISIALKNSTAAALQVTAPFWKDCLSILRSNIDDTLTRLRMHECVPVPTSTPLTTIFAAGEERKLIIDSYDGNFSSSLLSIMGAPREPGSYALSYSYNATTFPFRVVQPILEYAARVRLLDTPYLDPATRQQTLLKKYVHVFSLRWNNQSYLCVGKPQGNGHLVGDAVPGDLEFLPASYKRIATSASPIVTIAPAVDDKGNLSVTWIDSAGKRTVTSYPTNGGDTVAPMATSYRVTFGSKTFQGSQIDYEEPHAFELNTSTRKRLPWPINGIAVAFSKPISHANLHSLIGADAETVRGLKTNTLWWMINSLSSRSVSVMLQSSGPNALKDAAGNALESGPDARQSFTILLGDVNDDGVVDARDLAVVHRAMANLDDYNIFADLNGDGIVDAKDADLLLTLIKTPR